MTASALVTSREATVDPRDRHKSFTLASPEQNVTALQRWEPWVRASIAQQVLLSGIHVHRSETGSVTVSAIDVDAARRVAILPVPAPTPAPWAFDVATFTAPSVTAFRRQLSLVLSWAELRQERAAEILSQVENQTAFVAAVPYLHPSRTPRTLELLGMAIQLAVNVEVRVKHELACWRPVEYSPHVQPMLTTPGHGSLPSGHCTQAYVVAHVLKALLGLAGNNRHATVVQLERQAARIATNRVIAGVHFPIDSIAGRLLGISLGEYFVARCGEHEGDWYGRVFDGGAPSIETGPAVEFIPTKQPLDGNPPPDFYPPPARQVTGPPADALLEELWRLAKQEWSRAAAEWTFEEPQPPAPPPAAAPPSPPASPVPGKTVNKAPRK